MTMREQMARAMWNESWIGMPLHEKPNFTDTAVDRNYFYRLVDAVLDVQMTPTVAMTDAAFAVADATIGREDLRSSFVAHVQAIKDGK